MPLLVEILILILQKMVVVVVAVAVVVGFALGEAVEEVFVGLVNWFEVALELAHVDIYSTRS